MSNRSDGSTASYYQLPEGATELQHLISYRNMNSQIGEAFRACYRYGMASHSDQLRDAKKILFYAKAEVERLEKWDQGEKRMDEIGPNGNEGEHYGSEWVVWGGEGGCPVEPGQVVEVLLRNSALMTNEAGKMAWFHDTEASSDIIRYRIIACQT